MQPGFDLRIRSMIKALSETVLPAVDTNDRAAVEQLHLVLGSLNMLGQQMDYLHWYEVVETRDMVQLLEELRAIGGAGETALSTAEALDLAARHDVRITALRDSNRRLRDAISQTLTDIFEAGDAENYRKAQSLALKHSRKQILRERAFVAGAGFDVFPDTLVSIEEALVSAD